MSEVIKALTDYSEKCEHVLLIGDFNRAYENYYLKDFTDSNDFENLINQPTYFKSISAKTIGLFLTNTKSCFLKSSTNKTGI